MIFILRIRLVESLSRWHGVADSTTVGGDVGDVTAPPLSALSPSPLPPSPPPPPPTAPPTVTPLAMTVPAALGNEAQFSILRIDFAESPSRWHGITDSTTVGGDVHTVTTATATIGTVTTITITAIGDATITDNCAACCFSVSGAGAGGA